MEGLSGCKVAACVQYCVYSTVMACFSRPWSRYSSARLLSPMATVGLLLGPSTCGFSCWNEEAVLCAKKKVSKTGRPWPGAPGLGADGAGAGAGGGPGGGGHAGAVPAQRRGPGAVPLPRAGLRRGPQAQGGRGLRLRCAPTCPPPPSPRPPPPAAPGRAARPPPRRRVATGPRWAPRRPAPPPAGRPPTPAPPVHDEHVHDEHDAERKRTNHLVPGVLGGDQRDEELAVPLLRGDRCTSSCVVDAAISWLRSHGASAHWLRAHNAGSAGLPLARPCLRAGSAGAARRGG